MKTLSLCSNTNVILEMVSLTESPFERMRGLLGRQSLPVGHAMWFNPCRSIHTFFMQFSIDLIFLDREMVVTDLRFDVKPWNAVIGAKGCYSVLEVQSGWIDQERLTKGTIFIPPNGATNTTLAQREPAMAAAK